MYKCIFFRVHTGRSLRDDAIKQGFRSVLDLLREVPELLITEFNGTIVIEAVPEPARACLAKKSAAESDVKDEEE